MRVIRNKLFNFGVGFINIFRVARQRCPAKWTNPLTEQRANVRWHKTRKIKRIGDAFFQCHLANIVAVIQRGRACRLKAEHGLNLFRHGLFGGFHHAGFIGFAFGYALLHGPADRQIAIKGIMGTGLVGHHVRNNIARQHFREYLSGVAQQAYRNSFSVLFRCF